jgi:hypothetical protein
MAYLTGRGVYYYYFSAAESKPLSVSMIGEIIGEDEQEEEEEDEYQSHVAKASVTQRFPFIPLQYWLFTPELLWQSRGKWRILQGYNRETLSVAGHSRAALQDRQWQAGS